VSAKEAEKIRQELTTGYIDTMKTTTKEIFMTYKLTADNYRGFTEAEWIAIDNAFEALLTELEESADPDFAQSMENVVFAYDLDIHMEQEVKDMYDAL